MSGAGLAPDPNPATLPCMTTHARALLLFLVVAALLLAMTTLRTLTAPPALRTADAPTDFDATRAKARLARILGDQRPHSSDTPANDAVQARLVAELRAIGLQPRIDTRFACNNSHRAPAVGCGRVRNVLASIGPDTGKHLLIVSHYDSVPVGPGAGDDGIGVASMLEVASLLRQRPLVRPVTFLFNEGEELGLVGARAFLDGDPLRDRVDAVINVEARGVRGPVAMFETSEPNAAAVRLYAGAVRHPTSNSLAVSAYRLLPNSTDVTTFAEKGWLALNFAPTGNETRYHSAGDTVAALDPATLQHMGDQLLDTAGALAAAPTPAARGGEMLFADVLGTGMVTLPLVAGWIVLAGLILLFAAIAARRRSLPGVLWLIVAIVSATVFAWLGLAIVGALRHGTFWRAHQDASEIAIYAGAIGAGLIVLAGIRRRVVGQWRAAYWLLFVLLGALIGGKAPGGLIFFLLPPVLMAGGMLAARRWPAAETIGALLAALALFLTVGPVLGLLAELFNAGPLWILAVVGALVLLPWLIEAQPLIARLPRRDLLLAGLILPLLGWIVAASQPAYSADRQQQFSIEHVTDRIAGQSYWGIVNDKAPLPAAIAAMGQWRFAKVPFATRFRWQAPAPALNAPAAGARVVAQSLSRGERRIRLRLATAGADQLTLLLPGTAGARSAGVPGLMRPMDNKDNGRVSLFCGGRGCNGAEIDLVLASTKPVSVTLVARRFGLPEAARALIAARPALARPQYVPDSTVTLTRSTL
jgi:Peptidase family M28